MLGVSYSHIIGSAVSLISSFAMDLRLNTTFKRFE